MYPHYRDRYLPGMTLEAIRSLEKKAEAVVIIPTGAIEQHGPHLPVGVDSMLGQAWTTRLMETLDAGQPVYVGPPITYGKSNEHVGFPGTVWISRTTLRRILRIVVQQLHAWGFRKMVLLNTHGGNTTVLQYSLQELELEFPETRLGFLSFGNPDYGLSEQETTYGFHANEMETSLLLYIAPQYCDMDKAVCHYPAHVKDPGDLRPENAPATFAWISSDISETGIMGNAPAGSAEKGEAWMAQGVQGLVETIQTWLNT